MVSRSSCSEVRVGVTFAPLDSVAAHYRFLRPGSVRAGADTSVTSGVGRTLSWVGDIGLWIVLCFGDSAHGVRV